MSQGEKLWSRTLTLAWVVNFCLAFVFYFLMTTMALFAVERFAVSDTAGGLASSVFVIGATVARLFAGNLADLLGRRRVLLVALVVGAVAALCYVPASSLGLLLVVRALHGITFAVASTAAMTIAQSVIPQGRRAEGTGYFSLSMTLATAVGPALGLVVADRGGLDSLLWVAVGAQVVGALVALFLRPVERELPHEERQRLRRFSPREMLHPAVLPVSMFMLLMAVCYSGVLAYLAQYGQRTGLELGTGLFFVAYAVAMFGSRFFMGRLQDVRGDNIAVQIAVLAFALGLGALALARHDAVVVLAGVLTGLGFGTLMSAVQAIAVSRVPRHRMGVAISTYFFMVDLGIGVGPVLLGLLLGATGHAWMYGICAIAVLLGAGLYHLVHGRSAGRPAVVAPEAVESAAAR